MRPVVCFLLLSLALFGCKKSDSPTAPTGTNDFVPLPLSVGNTWIYYVIVSTQSGYDTNSISSASTVNSRAVYVLNRRWLFDKEAFYYDSGTLYGMRVSGLDEKLEIVFPKNPSVGQTWHVDDIESTLKIEATNESITVPVGTYSCYRVKYVADYPNVDSGLAWFSHGVGLIKLSGLSENRELTSVVLK